MTPAGSRPAGGAGLSRSIEVAPEYEGGRWRCSYDGTERSVYAVGEDKVCCSYPMVWVSAREVSKERGLQGERSSAVVTPSDRQGDGADEGLLAAVEESWSPLLWPHPDLGGDEPSDFARVALAAAGRVLAERLRAEAKSLHADNEFRLASGLRESANIVHRLCGVPEGAGGGEG